MNKSMEDNKDLPYIVSGKLNFDESKGSNNGLQRYDIVDGKVVLKGELITPVAEPEYKSRRVDNND